MPRRKEPETIARDPAPEPVAETPAMAVEVPTPTPPPTPRQRSGLPGALLGGAIAATAGFGLGHFNLFGLRPAPSPDLTGEVAALTTHMAELSEAAGHVTAVEEALVGLVARLATLEATPAPDLAGLQELADRLSAIEAMPQGDAASTTALASRLAALEAALQSLPTEDTAALQADLDAALARLSAAEAEAAARTAEAEIAAARAARDVALRALAEAVRSGAPFGDQLAALADPALDAALGPMAETGAPTLATLQSSFPDAARETLRLARDLSAEDGWTDRLVDFLAEQTEARSLTPREGDDADAILSRAEFALGEGRVADALAELATLDPAIAAPVADWTRNAHAHLSAMSVLAAAGGE